jgi:CheY-like chemotaxis protein
MDSVSSRVLIVDENEFHRGRLSLQLQGLGLNTSSVSPGPGGRKAVGAALMLNPAVVLFELRKLDLNAIAAISIIRLFFPVTAIIAMCSHDDALHLSVSGELGVTCYVRSDIDPLQLRALVCSLAGWPVPEAADSSQPSRHPRDPGNGRWWASEEREPYVPPFLQDS